MKAGDKVIVMGYRSELTGDRTIEEMIDYWGGFYGYEPYTGYPVFDDPKRVSHDRTPWVYDTKATREEAVAMMEQQQWRSPR